MIQEKMIQVFDIPNLKYMGKISLSTVDKKYEEWRSKGYGVLIDREGCICLDNEDTDDDGLSYQDQIKELQKLN